MNGANRKERKAAIGSEICKLQPLENSRPWIRKGLIARRAISGIRQVETAVGLGVSKGVFDIESR